MKTEKGTESKTMSALDFLLTSDPGKFTLPTKVVEISRLSEKFGTPFLVTVRAMTIDKFEEIKKSGMQNGTEEYNLNGQLSVLVDCMVDPSLKSAELREHFDAVTPHELAKKMFLSGEIMKLFMQCFKLSGFNDSAVTDVKN